MFKTIFKPETKQEQSFCNLLGFLCSGIKIKLHLYCTTLVY